MFFTRINSVGLSVERYNFWNLVVQCITAIGIGVGVLASYSTIRNFYNTRFWETRITVYTDLLETTGTLSCSPPQSDSFRQAASRFRMLYYGKSHLVETHEMKARMVQFADALDAMPPDNKAVTFPARQNALQAAALQLANACRESLSGHSDINDK